MEERTYWRIGTVCLSIGLTLLCLAGIEWYEYYKLSNDGYISDWAEEWGGENDFEGGLAENLEFDSPYALCQHLEANDAGTWGTESMCQEVNNERSQIFHKLVMSLPFLVIFIVMWGWFEPIKPVLDNPNLFVD